MSHHYAVFAIGLFTITSLANGLQNKNVVIKKTTRTTLGKYLKGHVFKKTFEAVDPQHCLSDCWEENYQCQSFNYFPFLDVCELNNASNETAPQDLIDNPDVVYLTNPMFGRHPKPQMPRHTMYKAPADIDPCGSNPCTNARYCVSDAVLGYRCETCNFPFNGPKCEEYFDPCQSNPCLNGGTCISTMTSYKCDCLYPLEGTQCQIVSNMYQFNLNGSGDHPYATFTGSLSFHELLLNFWFKTAEQNISYFLHHIPTSPSATERLSVWRDGNSNTFFVELWKGYVYNVTFPHLYPTNDNNWHVVAIVLFSDATINFYLDGVKREGPKLTKGVPYSTVYSFPPGELHIGYFKESNGTEYFFTGSIGNVDIQQTSYNYDQVTTSFSHRCVPRYSGNWQQVIWTGLFNLTQPVNCSARNPILGIYAKYFPLTSYFQWLEHTVSPPRDLDAFTMFFQLRSQNPPSSPTQIACYGDSADDCRLSVVINANSTMEMIIESARFSVDLIPIFNYEAN
ncbi:uncharacterized protein LOC114530553, partial [Dendronephthya gigantea]|uniref:uncharacterized protein LOC114530553 n=1 Tax=Dendronephthya gigantea TaxID=151771 RepID=UPI00106950D5